MQKKTVLVTGAGGYLGGELCNYLRGAGWRVIVTSRRPSEDEFCFSLDGGLAPGALRNVDALVHCAYDFGPSTWDDIYKRNVVGTMKLLNEAKAARIGKIITISSISAFEGCKSLYGKAKLEIEKATFAAGGMVLRPGLIYGGSNHGMFGRLASQVKAGRPVPLMVGSPCTQFLVHVEDLCQVIEALLSAKVPPPKKPWTVAHPQPWPLRDLLKAMAQLEGNSIRFIPIPWQCVWLGLRVLEGLGLKLGFKSDSVRSLAYQNLHPKLGQVEQAGLSLRSFGPGKE